MAKDLRQVNRQPMPKSPASNQITYGQGGDLIRRKGGSESDCKVPTTNQPGVSSSGGTSAKMPKC